MLKTDLNTKALIITAGLLLTLVGVGFAVFKDKKSSEQPSPVEHSSKNIQTPATIPQERLPATETTESVTQPEPAPRSFSNKNLFENSSQQKVAQAKKENSLAPPPQAPVAESLTTPSIAPKEELRPEKIFWVELGAGTVYTEYQQGIDQNSSNYGGFKSPAFTFSGGSMVTNHWGVNLSYRECPGEILSDGTIAVSGSDFDWRIFTAESFYLPYRESPWKYLFGLQQHQFPFTLPTGVNVVDVYQNQITTLSAGAQYTKKSFKRLRYEIFMRYQYPIATSGDSASGFSITPNFAFDGSIGQVYEITDNLRVGLYWYGQWHEFNFEASNDSGEYSGQQKIFNSTFDLRLKLEY